MTKRSYLPFLVGAVAVALAIGLGYWYRGLSVQFASYDNYVADLGVSILMMDALQQEQYEVAETVLASDIEGKTAAMILLYDKHRFAEREDARCVVTRKIRALYENKKILASREKLEKVGYPYDEVIDYLDFYCKGEPSHTDWTSVEMPAEGDERTTD